MSVDRDLRIEQRLGNAAGDFFFEMKMQKLDTNCRRRPFFSNHLPFETKTEKFKSNCK